MRDRVPKITCTYTALKSYIITYMCDYHINSSTI